MQYMDEWKQMQKMNDLCVAGDTKELHSFIIENMREWQSVHALECAITLVSITEEEIKEYPSFFIEFRRFVLAEKPFASFAFAVRARLFFLDKLMDKCGIREGDAWMH